MAVVESKRGRRKKAEANGVNYREMYVPRNEHGDLEWGNRYAAHAAGAAAMGGLLCMGFEVKLNEQKKEIIAALKWEMEQRAAEQEDAGKCPICGYDPCKCEGVP